MKKRKTFFIAFFLFLFLSIGVFFVGRASWFGGVKGVLESLYPGLNFSFFQNDRLQKLQEENAAIRKKLVDQINLEKENMALKDQFQTSYPKSQQLLPAKIVGSPAFIPNVSLPRLYIVKVGKKDGVAVGQAVVAKDNLVGKIARVSQNLSVVILITDPSISFAAKVEEETLGIIKGQNDETVLLDNVLIAQTMSLGDTVVTKGEINESGIGYPPNLVIGKIISIDKTQSNLFQKAKVLPLVDFSKLQTVFIVTRYE